MYPLGSPRGRPPDPRGEPSGPSWGRIVFPAPSRGGSRTLAGKPPEPRGEAPGTSWGSPRSLVGKPPNPRGETQTIHGVIHDACVHEYIRVTKYR
eukprot:11752403-Alexandrium_andersonii.AAC.1